MNYRHAYHAGNFADVVKHAMLCRVLSHLREKPAAFRVIDTHAGAGRYDLAGPEAGKTQEWRDGIGRLRQRRARPAGPGAARALSRRGRGAQPGRRARHLSGLAGAGADAAAPAGPADRLRARAARRRRARTRAAGDARAKAIAIDGWTALTAYVPPAERRGVVLIDPPFEQPDEFARLAQGLAAAHRKWPTGIYLLWYPIKDHAEVAALSSMLARLGIAKMLRVELIAAQAAVPTRGLRGSGLIAVNPPWTLHGELEALLPVAGRGAIPRCTRAPMTLRLAGRRIRHLTPFAPSTRPALGLA